MAAKAGTETKQDGLDGKAAAVMQDSVDEAMAQVQQTSFNPQPTLALIRLLLDHGHGCMTCRTLMYAALDTGDMDTWPSP